ncbi:hypothetical protein G7B40_036480 [Aetokthonos hydrillicola Thurmond2011]|jgi:hypothetical protein|uniref:LamG-like jellyroll fold domain-containing protein n=1 Tax=Aetokthonos hydrillicola Thurmond2011 TaxID=2712845 RepID=A0AAP5IGP0_9CYAN|nr:LamG-like jellyroll fold domain-containing protein [Aetokthonos hydrillicola]MBO3457954.1 hypothetical protein [Aetokthonos hydrillicola CCALA 1050]MBW4587444.1 hypothetical protein [Aetokthonos hydrillicola CCALA 1050]MDR9900012.1 hypothetical protein [Aetokthonos hydrillicola Thurmond2011]
MSNANLILHLKLDETVNNQALDSSNSQNNATVTGGVKLIPDDSFGSCLSFDGVNGEVVVAPSKFTTVTNSFTMSMWVMPTTTTGNDTQAATGTTGISGQRYAIFPTQGTVNYGEGASGAGISVATNGVNVYEHAANSLTPLLVWQGNGNLSSSDWSHIAVVYTNKQPSLYVNGKLIKTGLTSQQTSIYPSAAIGGGQYGHFPGKIANVRIYNKALSPEEIQGDMDNDLSAIASFNKTHPLDFNLYEGEDKEPVIFIENGTQGEELVFEISNNSGQQIILPSKSGSVTPDNYHFELRFRPNTLSPTSLQQLALAQKPNWSMSSPVSQADGTVSLYFLTTNYQALAANQSVALTLQQINGAADGGARTTRAEFLCPQFSYQSQNLSNYYREKTLSIINHRGKKNIPLHVGFIGSNRILNDGSNQTLILQINNVLKGESIDFNPKNSPNPSRLILYFDVDTDWALGTKSEVQNIGIKVEDWQPGGKVEQDWDIYLETQAAPNVPVEGLSAPYWILTHQNVIQPRLAAGHTIQITLTIKSFSSKLGQTNLYLRYENIPGYWDGTFVCAVEKSPVLFDSNGNVGIGISNPEAKLQVININQDPNGNTFILGPKGQSNLRLGYHQDYSWIQSHGSKPLAINLIGNNVGIGTSNPQNKLDVKGGAVIGSTYAGTRTADANSLLVEGTVTATKFVGEGAFVTGMIIMWSGTVDKIPTGWALCDGKNKTPDLSGKFIVGYKNADSSYGKIGNTGGAETVTLTPDQMPSHSHTGTTDSQPPIVLGVGGGAGGAPCLAAVNRQADFSISHTHLLTTSKSGGDKPHENRPPYYTLAYIMKT